MILFLVKFGLLILVVGGLYIFLYKKLDKFFTEVDDRIVEEEYYLGEKFSCPNFDITIDKYKIKKKGDSIDSYYEVADPEWIGLIMTIENTSSEVKSFSQTSVNLINSNGETITLSWNSSDVWGVEALGSPSIQPGYKKTGYIEFANTNQDNSNLSAKVYCGGITGKVYTVILKNR